MIDITKTYKTKKGFAVKLYDIIDGRVIGAVHLVDTATNTWCAATWNLLGLSHNCNFDLVEVPKFSVDRFVPKKQLKDFWYYGKHINVPLGTKYIYVSGNGIVWASTVKPSWYEYSQSWSGWGTDTQVGRADYTGNIKDSLVEVSND